MTAFQLDPRFDTLLGLVERYSPSGQEAPAVDWLVRRMRSVGYTRAYADAAGNAVGLIGDGPRQAVLLGHIDTVPGQIPLRRSGSACSGAARWMPKARWPRSWMPPRKPARAQAGRSP
jgi:hypothetical protein